jgi:hypothetical protein
VLNAPNRASGAADSTVMSTPPGGPPPPHDPNQPPYGNQPPPGGYGQAPPPGGYDQSGGGSSGSQNNGLAITSLVLGILGLIGGCFCFGGILSPIALVTGMMGRKKADASGGRMGGKGMAMAGIILGIIGTLILLAWIAFIIWAAATGEEINFQYDTNMD